MRTVGIIAEYNPFHTGHEYHIRKAKELSAADYAVVVMSPDFVQRGEPAIFDKYTRTQMALACGADLVLELPLIYATGSAEYFAEGAVKLLDSLGVIDTLCFGAELPPDSENTSEFAAARPDVFSESSGTDGLTEANDVAAFQLAARILLDEPEDYRKALQNKLRQGATFPRARARAAEQYLGGLSALLSSPNNILGVEYCKALMKFHSAISPLPLARLGNGYSDQVLIGEYCSAGALRNVISNVCISKTCKNPVAENIVLCHRPRPVSCPAMRQTVNRYIPASCCELFWEACETPFVTDDLLPILTQKLIIRDRFDDILDISPELSDRICSMRYHCIGKTFEEMTAILKTKQITEARIRRALLHLTLDIRSEDMERFRSEGTVFYAHILGFRKGASPLLHEIRQKSALPLISKAAHAPKLLSDAGLSMWKQDISASHLYRGLLAARYGTPFKSEYEISPSVL
ncbi:MAG: nucleotidyltransferase family protein [Lachnospiraceae bacterium]|nr:nucleotidyltransferase family protein [Lachnospiraceae bacterium]